MGNSKSQEKSAEEKCTDEQQLISAEAEKAKKACLAKEKKFKEKLKEIELSLEKNPSEENALLKYAEMLQLKQDMNGGLTGFSELIKDSTTQWDVVDTNLDKLKKLIPGQEIDDLKELRIDYFSLLLRTGVAISELLEQSDIQQENLDRLIELTNIQSKCPKFKFTKKNDQVEYDSCMETLKEFINEDILEKIVEEWEKLSKKLQARQQKFATYFPQKLIKKIKKQGLCTKIAIGIGSVVVIGGVVALIVASAGLATPVIAGIGAVATEAVVAGGIGLASGMVCVGGAMAYGRFFVPSRDTLSIMKEISDELTRMLMTSQAISAAITSGMIKYQKCVNQRLTKGMGSPHLKLKAFDRISNLLKRYSLQGNIVILSIDAEVKRILKQ